MLRLFLNVNDPLRAEPRTPRYLTVELERAGYAVVTPSVPAHTHTHTHAADGPLYGWHAARRTFRWMVRVRNQSNTACRASESIMAGRVVRPE